MKEPRFREVQGCRGARIARGDRQERSLCAVCPLTRKTVMGVQISPGRNQGPTLAPGGQEGDSIPAHDPMSLRLGSGKAEL